MYSSTYLSYCFSIRDLISIRHFHLGRVLLVVAPLRSNCIQLQKELWLETQFRCWIWLGRGFTFSTHGFDFGFCSDFHWIDCSQGSGWLKVILHFDWLARLRFCLASANDWPRLLWSPSYGHRHRHLNPPFRHRRRLLQHLRKSGHGWGFFASWVAEIKSDSAPWASLGFSCYLLATWWIDCDSYRRSKCRWSSLEDSEPATASKLWTRAHLLVLVSAQHLDVLEYIRHYFHQSYTFRTQSSSWRCSSWKQASFATSWQCLPVPWPSRSPQMDPQLSCSFQKSASELQAEVLFNLGATWTCLPGL